MCKLSKYFTIQRGKTVSDEVSWKHLKMVLASGPVDVVIWYHELYVRYQSVLCQMVCFRNLVQARIFKAVFEKGEVDHFIKLNI